jgi:cell division control protein 6
MYISGTPGVGKTLTIKSSQRIFGTTNELKDARIVNINAMQLCDPEKVFPLLYQELFCTGSGRVHVPPKHTIRQKLAERLQHSWRHDKHMTFLFVDEIDMLLEAKNVSVLHTLFEYPFHQDSKLVVIGIANSIDLTERTLPFLAQRNFAPKTLHFLPYNAEQLMSIIKQRIADAQRSVQNRTDIEAEATHGDNLWGVGFDKVDISDNAIEFCARKVAAVSGDVRKLLALCSKSITLAARGTSKDSRTTVVAIGHVSKAATELFGGKYVDIIRGLPQQQRVAVCAAVKLLRGSNATATTDANASSEAGGVWVDRNPPAKDPDLGKASFAVAEFFCCIVHQICRLIITLVVQLYSVYSRLCQSHGLQSVNAIEFTGSLPSHLRVPRHGRMLS